MARGGPRIVTQLSKQAPTHKQLNELLIEKSLKEGLYAKFRPSLRDFTYNSNSLANGASSNLLQAILSVTLYVPPNHCGGYLANQSFQSCGYLEAQ